MTVQEYARRWASEHLADGSIPAQVDLDALADQQSPSDAVLAALECAKTVWGVVFESGQEVDVAVTIPLGPSNELAKSCPTLAALGASSWDFGPGREVPGLYLVPPSAWEVVEPGEEYRRALDDPLVPQGFFAYYRVWRTDEEMARGWEYSRAIYVRSAQRAGR